MIIELLVFRTNSAFPKELEKSDADCNLVLKFLKKQSENKFAMIIPFLLSNLKNLKGFLYLFYFMMCIASSVF